MSKQNNTAQLVLVALVLVLALWVTRPHPAAAPSDRPHRRPLVKRVLRWAAIWWLASSAEQPDPRRSPVDQLYNAEPAAGPGDTNANGVDHGYGW